MVDQLRQIFLGVEEKENSAIDFNYSKYIVHSVTSTSNDQSNNNVVIA